MAKTATSSNQAAVTSWQAISTNFWETLPSVRRWGKKAWRSLPNMTVYLYWINGRLCIVASQMNLLKPKSASCDSVWLVDIQVLATYLQQNVDHALYAPVN